MSGAGDMTGIDGRFRSACRLLSLRVLLLGLLVVAGGLQLTVVGSVLLARSWVEPAVLRHILPWSTGGLLVVALGWMVLARSSRRLRRRAVRLLVDDAPEVHADIHAYFADNLVGGIRDEAVRDICRERLSRHLARCVRRHPAFRLASRPLWACLLLFLLIWLIPWFLGFTPPRLVADFRRLLRLRTTPLTILSFAPEREWLLPGQATVLRVTFNGTPMEEVAALLTDSSGQVARIPLRVSGDVYSAPFVTPAEPFQLQIDCENRVTQPRAYRVFPESVVSLASVEVVDGTGKVVAVHGPDDTALTVRFGRRLRWHVHVATCPLRAYGVSSRSVSLTRTAADTWECVAENDAEFFTFWEPHGETPIVQDRFQVNVVPDDPPEVSLSGPLQPEGKAVDLPLALQVSVQDDSAVRRAAVAVADLRGWQQVLPLELESDAGRAKGELALDETKLRGRGGRYLMVWAVAEDDGMPTNRGECVSRFYLLPEVASVEPPESHEQPSPPENDMASALADNLDQMAQQEEEKESKQGEEATANPQNQPGKENTTQDETGQQGQEEETAQNRQGENQPDQGQGEEAAQNQGNAEGQEGQPGQGENTAQAEPGENQPGEGQLNQPGQGEEAAQNGGGDQPGQEAQDPGNDVAQGEGAQGQDAQPGEGQGQGEGEEAQGQGAPGQGNDVAQGEGAQGQDAQPGEGQNQGQGQGEGAQGQGNDVAHGEGAQGQDAQPGEGPGEGQGEGGQGQGAPGQGNDVAQGEGAQGQGAQPGEGQGQGQGKGGQGQGTTDAGANGQAGNEDAGAAQGGAAAQGAAQAGGAPGRGDAGQVPGPPGQGVAGAEAPAGGTAVAVAEPGEGDGEGEKQQVVVRGPGGGGVAPPDVPLEEGPRQTQKDTVDESLRLAARQEGVTASEQKGAVLPAENQGETVATGQTGEHGEWGAGQLPGAAPPAVREDAAPAGELPAADSATPMELGGAESKPGAEPEATLVGAGGSGSRTALADSPVEQAIRTHEDAMHKLTGTEKAATREYYRHLKDIR